MTNRGLNRGVGGPTFGSLATPNGTPDYGSIPTNRSDGFNLSEPPSGLYNLRRGSAPYTRAATARAATGGAPVHIVCRGDSTTSATGISPASDRPAFGYPGALRTILDTQETIFGRTRKGLLPVNSSGIDETQGSLAGFNVTGGSSWGPVSIPYSANTVVLWFFSSPPTGNTTFTYAVDGGTASASQSTTGTAWQFGSITIPLGSVSTSHTLTVNNTGSNVLYPFAIEAYDNTVAWGAKVTCMGVPGAPSAFVDGLTFNTGSHWLIGADLMIINLGINNGSVTGRGYANLFLDLLSEGATAQAKGADLLLMNPNALGGELGGGGYGPPDRIRQAVYAAAERLGCPVADIQRRWATLPAAIYAAYGADQHPLKPGNHDIARLLAGAVRQMAEM